ncbi:hypothetical protein NET02_11070 [Thermomicrobiaceae bacterium CFH 74404]|uniref:Uncharacterized protein n=1 Tax=Thermalbibacter longus TaxID=2951981 RepID=A0AA41WCY6_9BACT|nr:hypothetical protein [Thermalbibacter longus]MCM8749692.1 hypothetical protein [Thermalbibacter longus]
MTRALAATMVTWGIVNAVTALLALGFELSPLAAMGRALPLALVSGLAAGLVCFTEQRACD